MPQRLLSFLTRCVHCQPKKFKQKVLRKRISTFSPHCEGYVSRSTICDYKNHFWPSFFMYLYLFSSSAINVVQYDFSLRKRPFLSLPFISVKCFLPIPFLNVQCYLYVYSAIDEPTLHTHKQHCIHTNNTVPT